MKKFNAKSLLVLVLVFVLVLSIGLVACNKKSNGGDTPAPGPGPAPGPAPTDEITVETFFPNMWGISQSIGGEAISASDNVALSLDLSVALRQLKNKRVQDTTFNIGIKLDVIYDRTSRNEAGAPVATNSAVRALLYDGETGETWCAVYYFLDEPNYLYFDLNFAKNIDFLSEGDILQDRYYKVAFATDHNDNKSYAGSVGDFVQNHKFGEKRNDAGEVTNEGFTIADVITALVKDTGDNWDLNKLIVNITGLFGLDLGEILEAVGNFLPGAYDESDGSIHIDEALASTTVQGFLNPVTTETDPKDATRKIYSTSFNETFGGLLNVALGAIPGLPDFLKTALKGAEIGISYGQKGDDIAGFALSVGLKALKDGDTGIYPGLELAINDLSLRKVANTKDAVRSKVAFDSRNWKAQPDLDVNTMLNAKATMEVEIYNHSATPKNYLVTAYSDIDPIDVIIGIVKAVKAETPEARVAAFRAIHSEAGLMAEELNADGTVKKVDGASVIPFQILASCPAGELSAVIGDKTYVIDGADLLANLEAIQEIFTGGGKTAGDEDDDEDEGGFDIQAILDAITLITENVTINGEELSLDSLKAAFLDENGKLKEDWHEFLLHAEFDEDTCDALCALFGGKNDNEVEVLIDKQEAELHLRAEYKNDDHNADGTVKTDAKGNKVMRAAKYHADFVAKWNLELRTLELKLDFDMWDEDAKKDVTYVCTYEGNLNIQNQLLINGGAKLRLTRKYVGDEAASPVFEATLTGEINYTEAKDSITDANIALIVSNGLEEADSDYQKFFSISGTLEKSGDGKLLVKFTDDGLKYVVEGNVVVETFWRESLVEFICGLEIEGTEIRAIELPEPLINLFKLPDDATIGDLLGGCHVYASEENVINTRYERTVNATTHVETEKFSIGLNEYVWMDGTKEYAHAKDGDNDVVFHLAYEISRKPAGENDYFVKDGFAITYVKVVANDGTGDTGIGLKLDTFDFEHNGSCYLRYDENGNFLGGLVKAPSREGANVIDHTTLPNVLESIMGFFMGFMD